MSVSSRKGDAQELHRRGETERKVREEHTCMSTAGPRYLSVFHQYDGQDVEQHAHKMHSYMPSSFLRSSCGCNNHDEISQGSPWE